MNEYIKSNPYKSIIIVSHDDTKDDVKKYLEENGYNWFVILDSEKTIRESIDPGSKGIDLIKKMNFSRKILVKVIAKNIYDVEKLRLAITNLDIKKEEIQEIALSEFENLEIFNLLKIMVEFGGDYDWIWQNIISLTHNQFYEIEFYEWLNILPNKYKINKNYKEQYGKKLIDIVNSSASEEVNNKIFKFIKNNKMSRLFNTEELNEEDREKFKNY